MMLKQTKSLRLYLRIYDDVDFIRRPFLNAGMNGSTYEYAHANREGFEIDN